MVLLKCHRQRQLFVLLQGLANLDISGNSVSPKGAVNLAKGIAASKSLAAIYLDSNTMHEDGVQTIMQSVTDNPGIMVCKMDGNYASEQTLMQLQEMLAQRTAQFRGSTPR